MANDALMGPVTEAKKAQARVEELETLVKELKFNNHSLRMGVDAANHMDRTNNLYLLSLVEGQKAIAFGYQEQLRQLTTASCPIVNQTLFEIGEEQLQALAEAWCEARETLGLPTSMAVGLGM